VAAKINPVKVKQDADKEERAGRFDKAIELLRQIVADNPRDVNTLNRIGDLYARMNRTKEALQEYAKVADFHARDGFYMKAIAVWKKVNKAEPQALEPYLNLADLFMKQGLMMEAKGQYQIVVDEYIKRGRIREAGDALKRMADIDPSDLKVRSKLADLYMRDGNSAKAVEEHVAIAEELGKKGHLAEALQVLEKGLKLDPRSTRMRSELARVHLLQKNYERAVQVLEEATKQGGADRDVFLRLGEAYLGAKRIQDAEAVLRRLLQQDPQDQDARALMGRVFLMQGKYDQAFEQFSPIVDRMMERKEGDRAAGVLQQIVQRNPQHVKSLAKLVEVYRQLRKDMLVTQTYGQMVEAYINQGQMDQAASILDILVGLEPHNDQHRSKLEWVRSQKKGGAPRPAAAPTPAAPSAIGVEEDFELAAPEEMPALSFEPIAEPAGRRGAPSRQTIELSPPFSEEDKEFIGEHLAEGRVFRKYGLADKARDQFDAIISRFPDHVEARQELRDVYKEKGDKQQAAEQCLALAEISRLKGDRAGAANWEAEAARFLPQAVAAPAVVAEPEPEPEPLPAADLEPAEEEIPLEVEEAGLEEPELETPSDELQTIDLGAPDTQDELADQFVDDEAPAPTDFEAEVGALAEDAIAHGLELPEDESAPKAAPAPKPKPAAPPKAPVAAKPAPKPSRIAPKPAAPPAPPPAAKRPSLVAKAAPAPAPTKGAIPPDLQRVLDEVESYVSLGFVDDAKEALGEMGAKYAGHPALVQKLAELGLGEVAAKPAAPPKPVPAKAPPPAKPLAPPKAAPAPPPAKPVARPAPPPPKPAPAPPPLLSFDAESLVEEPTFEEPPLALEEPAPPMEDEFPPPPDEPAGLETGSPSSPLDDAFGDLGLGEPTAPPAALSDSGFLGDEGGIDLGAELGDLFGAQAAVADEPPPAEGTDLGDAGLADIFKEFKKGVDKQLGKEDYDTRYNLGIAYKEMGLIDEAIAEFQLAAKDEGRVLECASMLGICFMEKGMPKLAVKWFEKGLAAPGRGDEEYQGLRYDLAVALEAAGETDRALSIFTELYGQDANFRDVATKVRELRAALR